ncbi:biopolymer transporter ExbD [Aquabacterium sp. A7-Y]|uniref:biopolymer transporter ExbD n=1 Tax=Aquabacterium sp. A7-Y TaxID=1349605 RepID=UPI00223DD2D9|nr:biopolymer transporter ExbD [Aquabacterium sp. A7-Y]MCW7539161.1 biopolymer transporter ExbD [Aquabacterium sp. A7-Y]
MPAVSPRGGSRRRTISEINMVPFIDVMLVLLIIFMVSAPMMTTGMIDVPSVGKAAQAPERVIEVVVAADETLKLKVNGKDSGKTTLEAVASEVKDALAGVDNAPVVISADKAVKYETVVKVMDKLRRAGVQRVGLSVKTTG